MPLSLQRLGFGWDGMGVIHVRPRVALHIFPPQRFKFQKESNDQQNKLEPTKILIPPTSFSQPKQIKIQRDHCSSCYLRITFDALIEVTGREMIKVKKIYAHMSSCNLSVRKRDFLFYGAKY